jgi:hypothetical protein
MRMARQWLAAAFVVSALIGTAALIDVQSSRSVAGDEKGLGDHWRNHGGHWSLWNAADKRWYYTDGNHWFYHDGNAWRLYRFDGHFGHSGFVHGEYKVPREEVKIVIPRHEVFVIR